MIRAFLIILFVSFGFSSYAQEDWMLKAQKMYELGHFEKIHDYIQPFLPSASRSETISAYRLLILSNIYEKKTNEADSLMKVLLNYENEYTLQNSDSIGEYADLYNSYKTSPFSGLCLSAGYINPFAIALKNYGTNNLLQPNNKYSANSLSFEAGASFIYYLKQNMSISSGLYFTQLGYSNLVSLNDVMKVNFSETQNLLSIPFQFKYVIGSKKIRPYGTLGVSFDKLLSSTAEITRFFNEAISPDVTGAKVDITKARAGYIYGINIGGGVDYKIKHAILSLDLRYKYTINSAVTPASRYASPDLIYKFYYVDNDFKIDFLSISFKYTYVFYFPKKQTIK